MAVISVCVRNFCLIKAYREAFICRLKKTFALCTKMMTVLLSFVFFLAYCHHVFLFVVVMGPRFISSLLSRQKISLPSTECFPPSFLIIFFFSFKFVRQIFTLEYFFFCLFSPLNFLYIYIYCIYIFFINVEWGILKMFIVEMSNVKC